MDELFRQVLIILIVPNLLLLHLLHLLLEAFTFHLQLFLPFLILHFHLYFHFNSLPYSPNFLFIRFPIKYFPVCHLILFMNCFVQPHHLIFHKFILFLLNYLLFINSSIYFFNFIKFLNLLLTFLIYQFIFSSEIELYLD